MKPSAQAKAIAKHGLRPLQQEEARARMEGGRVGRAMESLLANNGMELPSQVECCRRLVWAQGQPTGFLAPCFSTLSICAHTAYKLHVCTVAACFHMAGVGKCA